MRVTEQYTGVHTLNSTWYKFCSDVQKKKCPSEYRRGSKRITHFFIYLFTCNAVCLVYAPGSLDYSLQQSRLRCDELKIALQNTRAVCYVHTLFQRILLQGTSTLTMLKEYPTSVFVLPVVLENMPAASARVICTTAVLIAGDREGGYRSSSAA